MKTSNVFIFILSIITGAVVGGLVAQSVKDVQWLTWLAYGIKFGISTSDPFTLDLVMVKFVFGFMVDVNVASILGIIGALVLYKKLDKKLG